jgi:hypothetical protein
MISLSELAKLWKVSTARITREYGRHRFYPDSVLQTPPAKKVTQKQLDLKAATQRRRSGKLPRFSPLTLHSVWLEGDVYLCDVTCRCGVRQTMSFKFAQHITRCTGYVHIA